MNGSEVILAAIWMVNAVMILGVIIQGQGYTAQYLKEQTIDLQANRIKNAALALSTYPQGFIEIDLKGYRFRNEGGGRINISYKETSREREIPQSTDFKGYKGLKTQTLIEDTLCINHSQGGFLRFKEGKC
ncbi:MAG: hypothetical protein ABEJ95_03955 [Candidatus Nanohalobium sp.]